MTSTQDQSRSLGAPPASDVHHVRPFPGRLVAITATGPIYEAPARYTVLPLSSVLALHQELAARALDSRAPVVSSLARRVHGSTAYATWSEQTLACSIALAQVAPSVRLAILHQVLIYIRETGYADGIEPIVTAAIDSSWPWLLPDTLERVLRFTQSTLARTTFTDKVTTAVVDANTRTFSILPPGGIKRINVNDWLDSYKLEIDEWRRTGVRTPQIPGRSPRGGPEGFGAGGVFGTDDPGSRNPFGPGSPWSGGAGSSGANPGMPGSSWNGRSSGNLGGNDVYGPFSDGALRNIGKNGGPLGFGSALGTGGSSDIDLSPAHVAKTIGSLLIVGGATTIAVGGGLMALGTADGGISAPAGGAALGVGAAEISVGVFLINQGQRLDDKAEAAKTAEADREAGEKKTEEKGTVPVSELPDVPPIPVDQLPSAPKESDKYPNPHGGGSLPSMTVPEAATLRPCPSATVPEAATPLPSGMKTEVVAIPRPPASRLVE